MLHKLNLDVSSMVISYWQVSEYVFTNRFYEYCQIIGTRVVT